MTFQGIGPPLRTPRSCACSDVNEMREGQALYTVPVERDRGVGEPHHAHHQRHQVHALLRALLLQSLALLSALRLGAECSSCAQAACATLQMVVLQCSRGLPPPDCGWAHAVTLSRRVQTLRQPVITQLCTQGCPATAELCTAAAGQSPALLAGSQGCRHVGATAKLSPT